MGTPDNPSPVPNIIIKPPVFEALDVAVSDVGENVTLRIGNSVLTFPYADALKISQLIRVHAKRAKKTAGDMSRHWSAVAILDGIKE